MVEPGFVTLAEIVGTLLLCMGIIPFLFLLAAASSQVTFLMDSPLEKIHGDASRGLQGDLFVDLPDISKSTALVKVDLQKLVLYQQKRSADQAAYSQRANSDLQNTHARN